MIRLAIALAILAALFVGADRGAHAVADDLVATKVQRSAALAAKPQVDIGGFPFLTQVAAGVYDDVELTAHGLARANLRVDSFQAQLHGVHVPFGAVLHQSVREVPVDSATGEVALTYADIDRVTGLHVSDAAGDEARVSGSLSVAGRTVAASGLARLSVSGDTVVFTVHDVSVAGVDVGGRLSFRLQLPRLPVPVRLTGVTTEPDRVVVTGSAGSFVLHA